MRSNKQSQDLRQGVAGSRRERPNLDENSWIWTRVVGSRELTAKSERGWLEGQQPMRQIWQETERVDLVRARLRETWREPAAGFEY